MLVFGAALVATFLGHGAVVHPPPRNAIDGTLPKVSITSVYNPGNRQHAAAKPRSFSLNFFDVFLRFCWIFIFFFVALQNAVGGWCALPCAVWRLVRDL